MKRKVRKSGPIKGHYVVGTDSDKVLSPYSNTKNKKDLPKVKARVKKIAHELCYPLEVIVAIEKAQSEAEINRIMRDARETMSS